MLHPEPEPIAPDEESVWDYPRPPRVEDTARHIEVIFNGVTIADTRRAKRVLETSSPPVYYIPPEDVKLAYLTSSRHVTTCEWKGRANYYTVTAGDKTSHNAAWYYPEPIPGYEQIAGYIAFYPALMDACFVDGERVTPQPGGFYGGWITHEIKGPFKGGPGSSGW